MLSASYLPLHSVRAAELIRQAHPAKGEVNIEISDQQLLAFSSSYSQTVRARNRRPTLSYIFFQDN